MSIDAPPAPLAARLAAAPAVAGIVLLGVWVAGGLLTDSYKASVVLTTLWFGAAGLAVLLVAIRRRDLRVPVVAAYLVTAAATGGYLAYATLHDRIVHERVVVAGGGNVQVAAGAFVSGAHDTAGDARVIRVTSGKRFLTLTSFATAAGPDLRVRLVRRDGRAFDLARLKGNRGDQQYELPPTADLAGARVQIWCRAFSVEFGSAGL